MGIDSGTCIIFSLSEKLERLAGWLMLLSGWHRAAVAALAGAVAAGTMAPFDFVPAAFIAFPILVWLLDGVAAEQAGGMIARFRRGFGPGFFFGFGYFTAGLWWIGNALLVEADTFAWAMPFAVFGLPAVLAVFWGAATGLASLSWFGTSRRLFMLAGCFGLLEFARGTVFTGFPWNTISYAAMPSPLFMQTSWLVGTYALSALAVLLFCWPAIITPASRGLRRTFFSILCLGLIVGHVGFGAWRMQQPLDGMVEGVKLKLVQPAIPQSEKFDLTKQAALIDTYLSISTGPSNSIGKGASNESGLEGVTHLLWPESAFPFYLTRRRDVLASIAAMLPEETVLVTGAARLEEGSSGIGSERVFNSIYVVNGSGEITGAADKTHLVPFGEYLPFQDSAEGLGFMQVTQLEGGFSQGAQRRLLSGASGPPFLPLICYEIIFPGSIREGTSGAEWLLNVTNDAWFGMTPGPYQHNRQAIVRAVEEALPLVRVANNGISGVYDAKGRTIARMELGEKGALTSLLPAAGSPGPFAKLGHLITFSLVVFFLLIGLIPIRR